MWFKKGKDRFYFDSYEVQPSSELIAYLKLSIFYNSERVKGEVFAVIYVSSHWSSFRWEIVFKLF